jgi:hypothetical protein
MDHLFTAIGSTVSRTLVDNLRLPYGQRENVATSSHVSRIVFRRYFYKMKSISGRLVVTPLPQRRGLTPNNDQGYGPPKEGMGHGTNRAPETGPDV